MIASHGGWSFYKVPTTCTTDMCIASVCEAAGMVTPCAGSSECGYSNAICTVTSEVGCETPMKTTSHVLCGARYCDSFEDMFQYMGGKYNGGGAFGIKHDSYVSKMKK